MPTDNHQTNTMNQSVYPARLHIEYPERMSRLTTFFRLLLILPIAFILSILASSFSLSVSDYDWHYNDDWFVGGASSIMLAVLLMLLFRRKYPRWWFDFICELTRFSYRVLAYLLLLTDQYPSTDEQQKVALELDYPDAKRQLHPLLPLVKWLLAIPHYLILAVLFCLLCLVTVFAWFAIVITARYPRPLFDFSVGILRWWLRVNAYAFLLMTDRYPPFSTQ